MVCGGLDWINLAMIMDLLGRLLQKQYWITLFQILRKFLITEQPLLDERRLSFIYLYALYAALIFMHCRAKWSVLLTQYCAGDKIEKNEMGWTCCAYGWGEGAYRVLVGKPEGKRPLGRPRRRWVDNIRMDLQEVGCEYVDWIGLAQDRDRWRTFVSAVMNLRVP